MHSSPVYKSHKTLYTWVQRPKTFAFTPSCCVVLVVPGFSAVQFPTSSLKRNHLCLPGSQPSGWRGRCQFETFFSLARLLSIGLALDSTKWIGCNGGIIVSVTGGTPSLSEPFISDLQLHKEIAYSSWIRLWHSWVWQAQLQLIVWSYLMTF